MILEKVGWSRAALLLALGVMLGTGWWVSGQTPAYADDPQVGFRNQSKTPGQANVSVTASPTQLRAAPLQRVGVTYIFREQDGTSATILSSVVEFRLKNGTTLSNVTVPVSLQIPAHGVTVLASDVVIDPAIVSQMQAANTDEVIVRRYFLGKDAGGNPLQPRANQRFGRSTENISLSIDPGSFKIATGISADVTVRLAGTLGVGVTTTEIIVDDPLPYKAIGIHSELRAHAFIHGTGSGQVIGRWLVDDMPVETFTASIKAGRPASVTMRRSVPTLEIGEHRIECEIISPSRGRSKAVVYSVSGTAAPQRVRVFSPGFGAVLTPDAGRVAFRWGALPGASGYEIAFAKDLRTLGLDSKGNTLPGLQGRRWHRPSLVVHERLSVNQHIFTPTTGQYRRLFLSEASTLFWVVRAILPGHGEADPSTISYPRWVTLVSPKDRVELLGPSNGSTVTSSAVAFRWKPVRNVKTGVLYHLTVMQAKDSGRVVLSADTRGTSYAVDELGLRQLRSGRAYKWQVQAVSPGVGVLATSESRVLSIKAEATSSVARYIFARYGGDGVITAVSDEGQIAFDPLDGSAIQTQKPVVTIKYPEARSGMVRLYVDGVDVSRLCKIGRAELTYRSPQILNEGEHEAIIVLITASGDRLEAVSRFRVDLQGQPAQIEPTTIDGNPEPSKPPIQLQFETRYEGADGGLDEDDFSFGVTLLGGFQAGDSDGPHGSLDFNAYRPVSGKMDVSNFLASASLGRNRPTISIGDVGLQQSEFTAAGLTSRAVSFDWASGDLKVNAATTLGENLGQSSMNNGPDVLVASIGTRRADEGRGIKLIFTDSAEVSLLGGSTLGGKQESQVWSVVGGYPLFKGLSLRGEYASSHGSDPDFTGGSIDRSGKVAMVGLSGKIGDRWDLSGNYRRVDSGFISPASNTLTNNQKGYDLRVNAALTEFMNLGINFESMRNDASEMDPSSDSENLMADLSLIYPNVPSFQLRYTQSSGGSDPFTGGQPSANRERRVAGTFSHGSELWDASATYEWAQFDDFYDVLDVAFDTPQDRKTSLWHLGMGMRPGRWRLRADWSSNVVNRFDRDVVTYALLNGADDNRMWRLETEYKIARWLTTSWIWGCTSTSDLLGISSGRVVDSSVRLNFLLGGSADSSVGGATTGGSGFSVSLAWRHSSTAYDGAPKVTDDMIMILLNNTALFPIR